jgi:hypothetical protein
LRLLRTEGWAHLRDEQRGTLNADAHGHAFVWEKDGKERTEVSIHWHENGGTTPHEHGRFDEINESISH